MNSYLIILALCTSPSVCIPSDTQATLITYERLVDCVRDKQTVPAPWRATAECSGKPFDPRQLTLG